DRAGDQLQQRALAGAVPPHHAPALAAPDLEVEALVDDAAAVAFADAREDRDVLADARRLLELERHDHALLRRLDALDLVDLLLPALRLRRLGDVRAEAVDEALHLGEHRLLALVRRLLPRGAFALLLLEEVVVAGVGDQLAVVDVDDAVHDPVHEVAV